MCLRACVLTLNLLLLFYQVAFHPAILYLNGLRSCAQDAIWHSAIVVRDQEYYFGYGIEARPAGQTMFGAPTEVITLG